MKKLKKKNKEGPHLKDMLDPLKLFKRGASEQNSSGDAAGQSTKVHEGSATPDCDGRTQGALVNSLCLALGSKAGAGVACRTWLRTGCSSHEVRTRGCLLPHHDAFIPTTPKIA